MRLISLSLHNYRKFADAEVEFPDGVTGIIGLNGVGKSSLVEAIAWVLYGHDATRTKKEGIKRSQAPKDADCSVNLKLELNGDFYEISRALRGVNLSTDASIIVNGKALVRSSEKTTKETERLLGMDRRSFFRSFYAKQKELSILSGITPRDRKDVIIKMLRIDRLDRAIEAIKIDKKERTIKLDILRSQISDKRSLETDMKETESALSEIVSKKEAQAKIVDELTPSLENAHRELERLEGLREKEVKLRNRLVKLQTELENSESTIVALKTEIDSLAHDEKEFLKLAPAVEDLERLRNEEAELFVLSKRFSRQQSLIAQLKRDEVRKEKVESRLSAVRPEARKLEELIRTLEEAEESLESVRTGIQKVTAKNLMYQNEIEILKRQMSEIDNSRRRITKLGKDARCPTCKRHLGDDYPLVIDHFEKEKREVQQKISLREDEIEGLKKRLVKGEEMEAVKEKEVRCLRTARIDCEKRSEEETQLLIQKHEFERSLIETRNVLGQLGEVRYDEEYHAALKEKIEEKLKVQERLTAYRTKLDSRPGLQRKKEETERRREGVSEGLKEIETELNSLDYSRDAYLKTKSEFENMRERRERERGILHSIELDLRSAEDRLETMRLQMEEMSKREEEARELRGTIERLTQLVEMFVDFRLQLIQRVRPRLASLASALFERMTEGRYQGIELSEDYELSLVEEGRAYTIDRFSGGETDLANLSLRLAISELIMEATGNELSFIILDEIFGSQDIIRKGLIMDALKELSRRFRQILLITHVEEIKDSLENVIEMYEADDGVSAIRQE